MEGPILVGVDGSPESRVAAHLGRRVADALDAPLLAVTASIDVLVETAAARVGVDLEPLRQSILKRCKSETEAFLSVDGGAPSDRWEVVARCGRPEAVLEDLAEESGASLIVLGGIEPGAAGILHRTTALHLLRAASVPVLVVEPKVARSGLRQAVIALDTSAAAAPTWEAGSHLCQALGIPVRVVHVVSDQILSASSSLAIPVEDLASRLESHATRFLQDVVGHKTPLEVVRGDPEDVIAEAARREEGTLLVVGSHGLGWFSRRLLGSVAEGMVRRLPASVLIVPPGDRDGE